ncbi:MAG: hydroxyacid dehydrogenase [Rhodoplanes sp.]|uniref:hydroxyacid dehydrogenase n=1 Tax=Rhodoplanes sp. TaxID=1968906 RepID=UPI0017DED056|nr:hydroxyacid dehydrogenase [Rhodoplanes sp.]NVO14468.1 hydroxyacid dehydrogenase [Rhodoplanes sp.]
MQRVLLSHRLYPDGMAELAGKVDVVVTGNGDSDQIIGELERADGFILRIGKIDRKAMLRCPRLRVIARPGVGVDNVDVGTATELGIPVVIAPRVNSRSVAEHAIALVFAVAKNIVESDVEARKGNFEIREKYASVELLGRKVGVVGFGNIGRETAALAAACGMPVGVYDPFVARADIEAAGHRHYGEVTDLLRDSDVVTLHIPSTPDTRRLIRSETLALMKPDAFLINCSRGDLVDEDALLEALRDGRLAGAGLDVLQQEPMKAGHPLFALPNVVVTPHLAAQTREATARGVVMAARGTLAVLAGQRWENVVNKAAYDHPRWRTEA